MRAVQLLPDERSHLPTEDVAERSIGAILAAGVGIFAVVGGYWGYSQVSQMNAEAGELAVQAAADRESEATARRQTAELGERTSYARLAANTQEAVTSMVEERFPYAHLLSAINDVVPAGSMWISELQVSSSSGGTSGSPTGVSFTGVAIDEVTITAFHQRLRAVPGLEAVLLQGVTGAETMEGGVVQEFTMSAGIEPSFFSGASGASGDVDATLVAGGEASAGLSVAIEPVPRRRPAPGAQPAGETAATPAPEPEPLSPLEKLARSTANASDAGGGSR